MRAALILGSLLSTAACAQCHALKARINVTATEIVVLVNFDGDDDLQGAVTVVLLDSAKATVGTAQPDAVGRCRFPRPLPGNYTVVASDAGFGHRIERALIVGGEQLTSAEPPPPSEERPRLVLGGLAAIGAVTLLAWWLTGRRRTGA